MAWIRQSAGMNQGERRADGEAGAGQKQGRAGAVGWRWLRSIALGGFALGWLGAAGSAEVEIVRLPPPEQTGGRPLMEVLRDRQSIREFGPGALSDQELSNLLWAAFGINRQATAHRTAPSAMNSQEIDLYVGRADGWWRYQASSNVLEQIAAEDVRSRLRGQPYVTQAPLLLVFVADFARMPKAQPADRLFYAAADTGFISQNVYLYCASRRLATVVWAIGADDVIRGVLKLGPDQRPILAQSVGYPKAALAP
jgi:SagB-type dehydrogenase family enzyme